MESPETAFLVNQGNQAQVSRLPLGNSYSESEGTSEREDLPMLGNQIIRVNTESSRTNAFKPRHRQKRTLKGKWRCRIRRKIRVVHSSVSALFHRLRLYYNQVVLALATKARESSVLPLLYRKKPKAAIRPPVRSSRVAPSIANLTDAQRKYWDYIQRSVADGETAYFAMAVRNRSLLY